MKTEYREGSEARKKFEERMTKLFRVPKSTVTDEKSKPNPKHKRKTADKG
jgi:hypothetical protein